MVSIFLPDLPNQKMHNLLFGKFFIKKPEEIKRRYKNPEKGSFFTLQERTGLHRTLRCNHGAVNWGLIGFFPPRPRRPDLRKHDVAGHAIYAVVGIWPHTISVYGRISDHVLGQA